MSVDIDLLSINYNCYGILSIIVDYCRLLSVTVVNYRLLWIVNFYRLLLIVMDCDRLLCTLRLLSADPSGRAV